MHPFHAPTSGGVGGHRGGQRRSVLWVALARKHAGIACFLMFPCSAAGKSCRTRAHAAAAPLSRCGCLTRPRHLACARWHALRRDTCGVGGCSALPRCCAACSAMHSGPLCLQEGASNLLLSLALAHWIKVGERYPAGRPDLPFRRSPGGAPVEHSCCARCTFPAQRACSAKRAMQVGACCTLTASACPRRRAVLALRAT